MFENNVLDLMSVSSIKHQLVNVIAYVETDSGYSKQHVVNDLMKLLLEVNAAESDLIEIIRSSIEERKVYPQAITA